MDIADNILRSRLKNVYFIWGRGKTTIANALREKYGFYVYSTDDSRLPHLKEASPQYQPYMCLDYQKQYGVRSLWELPKEIIREREQNFVKEMTPMILLDLIELSVQHDVILCEGDIDYRVVLPLAVHTVYLCNRSTTFDWFARPDHEDISKTIRKRTDLSEEEKQTIIENARNTVAKNEGVLPEWVLEFDVKSVIWDDTTSVEQTAAEVGAYFGFSEI